MIRVLQPLVDEGILPKISGYGDIRDLANVSAWKFMMLMSKLYDPDPTVTEKRMNVMISLFRVLLRGRHLDREGVQFDDLLGEMMEITDEYVQVVVDI